MANQDFYRPQSGSPYDDEQGDDGYDPLNPNQGSARGQEVSDNAQNTLDNVESALRGMEVGQGGNVYDRPGNEADSRHSDVAKPPLPGSKNDDGDDKSDKSPLDKAKDAEGIGKGKEGDAKEAPGVAAAIASGNKAKVVWKAIKGMRNRKKGIIGGIVAAFIATVLIAGMFITIPLKILSMTTNLENIFFASSEDAANRFDDNLIKHYLIDKVVPGMVTHRCASTNLSKSCADIGNGDNIVTQMYRAWSDANLEGKLADKYGIEIRKVGDQFYLRTPQLSQDLDLGTYDGNTGVFEDKAFAALNRTGVRTSLRSAVKAETFSRGMYLRYTVGKIADRKYGLVRCVMTCALSDKVNDAIDVKTKAIKLYFLERVVTPYNQSLALTFECGMNGFTCTKLEAADDNGEQLSPYQKDLKTRLTEYRLSNDGPGRNSLEGLDKDAENLKVKGLERYLIEKLIPGAAGRIAADSVPVVNMVLFAVQAEAMSAEAGPALQSMSYVMNSTAAVQTFGTLRTASEEINTGHIDPAVLGSINSACDQDPSADQNGAPCEASKVYQATMVNPTGHPLASYSLINDLAPKAYASDMRQELCDDGKPVPQGQLVCDEMRTDNASLAGKIASVIADFQNSPGNYQPDISVFLNNILNKILPLLTNAILQPWVKPAIKKAMELTHADHLEQWVAQWVMGKLIPTWVTTNPSGARYFDASAMGADVLGNDAAHLGQGAKVGSAHDIQAMNDRVTEQRNQEFAILPLKDKLFSTDQSQSFVSQLAIAMPSSGSSPMSLTASLIEGFSNMTMRGLAAMFTPSSVSALTQKVPAAKDYDPGQKPTPDPFGIPQYYWPTNDSVFTDDPETVYDNNNCKDPNQIKNWGDTNTTIDPNTQQPLQNATNPCLLIRDGVTRDGGWLDSSLISGYGDNDPESTGDNGNSSGGTVASGELSWPLDDSVVSKYKSSFIASHVTYSGTAWGADNMGTTDKGSGIADDIPVPIGTKVKAILGGKVTSTNLCGAGDGIAIKSTVDGHTIGISYMHGTGQQVQVGDTVQAGDYIINSGESGCRVHGAHLHVGMAVDGKYVCPQDVFVALAAGKTPDWGSLAAKANPGCGGRSWQ